MYVKNIQKTDINLNSFDGFAFVIPPGVSWLWSKAAEHLLANIYRAESRGGHDLYGFSNGHGMPPLQEATQAEWEKGGRQLAQVRRFKIDSAQIPRSQLIIIAQKRGVPTSRLTEFQFDPNIEPDEIAQDINSLPIPEEVRLPEEIRLANEDKEKVYA